MPFKKADRASALATLYTGATPSLHGIIAQNWLDRSTLRPVNCMDDPDFMGNYTDESSSPSQLLVSTLADELKVATRNQGLVLRHRPFPRSGNPCRRAQRERRILAERKHREMVQHHLLS